MPCYFCQASNHLSEDCKIYPTLQSRYSNLKYSIVPCLCRKISIDPDDVLIYSLCYCKTFCEVCLQHHHIALCPKRDPNHRFYLKELLDPINLFSLGYHVVKRFLALANPIDRIKLHLTCKFLNQLQPLQHKINRMYQLSSFKNAKIIGVGATVIGKKDNLELIQKYTYPNFSIFYIRKRNFSKSDLKILSKSDPIFVNFEKCKFAADLHFCDLLQNFSYVLGMSMPYHMLPKTWITDLINAKRNVNLRFLKIYTNGRYPTIDVNELMELFKKNKDLFLSFHLGYNQNFTVAWKKIEAMMKHERFAVSSNAARHCIRFMIGTSPMMFSFNRNGLH